MKNKSSGLPDFIKINKQLKNKNKLTKHIVLNGNIENYYVELHSRIYGPYVQNKFLNNYKILIYKK